MSAVGVAGQGYRADWTFAGTPGNCQMIDKQQEPVAKKCEKLLLKRLNI